MILHLCEKYKIRTFRDFIIFSYFAVTLPACPAPPSSLKSAKETTSTVTLEWKEPVDDGGAPITSYLIDMKGPNDDLFKTLVSVDGDVFTFTVTKLDSGSEYDFQIRAENDTGISTDAACLTKPVTTKSKASETF